MRLLPFALPLVVLLAACGNDANPPPAPTASSASTATAQVAAAAGDDKLAPLFGTWALDPAQCGQQVLKISKARFEGAENGCDISGFTDNGDGTFTASMRCTGEGQTVDEKISMRPIFGPTGEGVDLVYLDRNNLTSEVLRCPEPAAK